MKSISKVLIFFLLINLIINPCGRAQAEQLIDGVISDQEYPLKKVFQNGDYELSCRVDGEIITFAMKAKTSGWIAVGIDPEFMMLNTDIYFGWVTKDGDTKLYDTYCNVETGLHPPDTEQGGTNDITGYAGKEEGSYTTIEFSRKLNTNDAKDKVVPKTGKLKVMVAYGSTDQFTTRHIFRTTDSIDMDSAQGSVVKKTIIKFKIGSMSYSIDSVSKTMDSPPIVKDGRTLLPIRYLAEAIGAKVSWDSVNQRITILLDKTEIILTIGLNTALINGVTVKIDPDNANVKPIIVPPGRTLLPLRFVAERLNCLVEWNQANQEITITYPK